jgi:alpha-D-ribose 1-methylphosphonate 5-triphosphate synthase subunit PhnG
LPEAIALMRPPPALQPVTHTSRVVAPVAVALTAIARAIDADTPREFSGKNDNPVTQLLRQAEIGLTVTRGTMSVSGQPNTLSIITPLNGSVRITGRARQAG